ncbi:MAG: winged helix-turn-helix transcriptional regulator [Candidatus Aenigmarchaeota archaeon]|nr:winged helix-turn-helix transcriptional regulator [Candidatus Aenigmarchaeota archaeon]
MEDKITLDRETFRVLASETRIDVLKSLDMRRKTLTELSNQFGMSASTIKEHMDSLAKAGLVIQLDEGRKWKYYELTIKGKRLLHPSDVRIWLLLSASAIGMTAVGYDLLQKLSAAGVEMRTMAAKQIALPEAASGAPSAASDQLALTISQAFPYWHIVILAGLGILLGIGIGHLASSRKRTGLGS